MITCHKGSEITVNKFLFVCTFPFVHVWTNFISFRIDFNSNREDFNDRRQPFANRGFNNQQRGVRGGPAFRGGNFGGRGNMRGGKMTN